MEYLHWIIGALNFVLFLAIATRLVGALVMGFKMEFGRWFGVLLRCRSLWVSVAVVILLPPTTLVLQAMNNLADESEVLTGPR